MQEILRNNIILYLENHISKKEPIFSKNGNNLNYFIPIKLKIGNLI